MDFSSPIKAQQSIATFLKEAHEEVERAIMALITPLPGQCLPLTEDTYLGYPRVYSDDAHCSIEGLKKLSIRSDRLFLSTEGHRRLRIPHADGLTTNELLQIWDIALGEIAIK